MNSLQEALVGIEREHARRQRVDEALELVPDVDVERARRRRRHHAPRRRDRRAEPAQQLAHVDAQQVVALQRKEVVRRVEQRAVHALHVEPAGQRQRHGRARTGAHEHVELAGREALDAVLERGQAPDLVHGAGHTAAAQGTVPFSNGVSTMDRADRVRAFARGARWYTQARSAR